ncbi:MAG TPA: UdgX family uracil-DNA binding protein, partial [Actinomycetota bacterium]|nr:UdgX family uracil-DNA binding protein [Actinomycetota bacterium]
ARIVMVGEQPGDREDLDGRPFVGPAGVLLDRAIEQAGLSRDDINLTNVVKHFKHVMRGKRRIHKKPDLEEIRACTPWLDAELARIEPKVLVLLGATAAQAILGRAFRVTQHRGEFVDSPLAPLVTASVHPSSILRSRTDEERRSAFDAFVKDLQRVARAVQVARG